jgi:hypothetical protein
MSKRSSAINTGPNTFGNSGIPVYGDSANFARTRGSNLVTAVEVRGDHELGEIRSLQSDLLGNDQNIMLGPEATAQTPLS